MRLFILFLLSLIALQSSAQFTYSIKAGWSLPSVHKDEEVGHEPSLTLGTNIDYAINNYFGLQSGLNYKRIYYAKYYTSVIENAGQKIMDKAHYVEIPLLFTISAIPSPERWRAIWNAGIFADIPVGKNDKSQTYYGIMAALQIEILSHYFLRGEYQWALSSDKKGEWSKDRRTNILSATIGYRF